MQAPARPTQTLGGRLHKAAGRQYAFEPALLDLIAQDRAVSLESEVFPGLLAAGAHVQSAPQRGYFVDFGTPASYAEFEAYLAGQASAANAAQP